MTYSDTTGLDQTTGNGYGAAGLSDVWPHVKPLGKSLMGALVLGILGSLAGAAQPLMVSRIIDTYGHRSLAFPVVALIVLLTLSALLTSMQQLILKRSGEQFSFSLRSGVIDRMLNLPISVIDANRRGDLVSRVTADVATAREIISQGIVELCSQSITIVVAVVLMALIDPVLLLVVVTVAVALVIISLLLGRRSRPAAHEQQQRLGLLAARVDRSLSAIRTIRATCVTADEVGRAISDARSSRDAGLKIAWLKAMVNSFVGVAVQVMLLGVIGVGGLRVASGKMSIGQLSAFVMYVMLIIAPMMMLATITTSVNRALGSFDRVKSILDMAPEGRQKDVPLPAVVVDATSSGDGILSFDHVGFSYPDSSAASLALDDVTFDVNAGMTALVGPSGAGKTTVFGLVEQFYDPTHGRILFGGQEATSYGRDTIRRQIAYVEQDAPALSGTIRDNLRLGRPTATDAECVQALADCNPIPLAMAAQEFLDQEIGENGVFLNGGERQRLATARALLSDAPILLLDEATSNLDSGNEAALQDIIVRAKTRRAVIVIAHRLSTILNADRIIVIDNGRIIASGTHHELMENCPLCAELVRLQHIGGGPGRLRG